jgi:hypothetical protein
MMNYMKQKLLAVFVAVVGLLISPTSVLAQDAEDKVYDARLEGYGTNLTLEKSSTALMWLLLFVLAAMCVGVMFKNAKRTHLD